MAAKRQDRKPWNAFPLATLDVRGISPCAADCLRYLGIRSNYLGETVVGQKRMREDMNGRSKDYVTTGLKELEEKGIVTTIGRKRSDSQADKHIISRSILSEEYRKVLEALEANNPAKQENFPSDNPASQDDAFFNDPTERELENPAFGSNNPAEQAQTLQTEPRSLKPNLTEDQNQSERVREGKSFASLTTCLTNSLESQTDQVSGVAANQDQTQPQPRDWHPAANGLSDIWKHRTGSPFTPEEYDMATALIKQQGHNVVEAVFRCALFQRTKSAKMLWGKVRFKVFVENWQLNYDAYQAWNAEQRSKGSYALPVVLKFNCDKYPDNKERERTVALFRAQCKADDWKLTPEDKALYGYEDGHVIGAVRFCCENGLTVTKQEFINLVVEAMGYVNVKTMAAD